MTAAPADRPWPAALWHALPLSAVVLGLFGYWFGAANRYVVFLYEHLGAGPFHPVTVSRYWMSGLVAGGVVCLLYSAIHWLWGRRLASRGREAHPPAWWRVWLLCLPPLALGIPAIVSTVNQPTMPPGIAAACTLAALAALALALWPAALAAREPRRLFWLAVDGAGLVPVLLLLRAVEFALSGFRGMAESLAVAGGALAVSVVWLGVASLAPARWRGPAPGALALWAAGLCLSYLLLPLAHYLFSSAGFLYITAASNFFPERAWLQAVVLLVAGWLTWAITRLRRG
ncbi:MAG: hypothetical protein GX605_12190 [Chloroflexi bacterium]|nr:hypothetical protein [Chloroflexota bacterium]